MKLNQKKQYWENWLERLYWDSPYSLYKLISQTKKYAKYNITGDFSWESSEDLYEKNLKAKEIIDSKIQKIRDNISDIWRPYELILDKSGEKIHLFLPLKLVKIIEKYRHFIQKHPNLLDTLINPQNYSEYDVLEIIMQLPENDPEVKRFHYSCMKYGFTNNLITEIIDTPVFEVSSYFWRFIPKPQHFSDDINMKNVNENTVRLYTNGVEDIKNAFLDRFWTKKEFWYGRSAWDEDSIYYLNSALSNPYTNVEDIRAQQLLFEHFNIPQLSNYSNILSQVEKYVENFRKLLYPAKIWLCFHNYEGYSVFDMYHDNITIYKPYNYSSLLDYEGDGDPDWVNEYLIKRYGDNVNIKQVLLDGLSDLKNAKELLELFFEKLEIIWSPILTDLKLESRKFFKYYDHRFLFRPRLWKWWTTVIHDDDYFCRNLESPIPNFIKEFENFQTNLKALNAMFKFLNLVQKEWWSKITFDNSKPTWYKNAWHLKFDKSNHTLWSISHTSEITIFAGSNASGKSFSWLKRDAYIRMAMQSFWYAPCDSWNLNTPISSILFLDRPYTKSIKKHHFGYNEVKTLYDPSAFMQEAKSIADSLKFLTSKSVVYMDEVFTTTSPEDQAALLLWLIEYLKEKWAEIILATHNEYVLKYFDSMNNKFKANIMHFWTKKWNSWIENTYKLEFGSSDSNFLSVCYQYQAPICLTETAQRYLEWTWKLSEQRNLLTRPVLEYTQKEREKMKQISISIMHLFQEADSKSILKLYSQDDSIQSWMNFESLYLNKNNILNIRNNKKPNHNMFDEMMNDTRYYSLLTKLLLNTSFNSSQETLERQTMFSELQKISKKDYITIFNSLEFLWGFDSSLETLEEIDNDVWINRYLPKYSNIKTTDSNLSWWKKIPTMDISLWNLWEIQNCIELNTLIFWEKAPESSHITSLLNVLFKIQSYKSLDLEYIYNGEDKQYYKIPWAILPHLLKIIPQRYIPKDTSKERIKEQRKSIENLKKDLISQWILEKNEFLTDNELKELFYQNFVPREILRKLFMDIIPEDKSYEIIVNLMDDFETKLKEYIDSLPIIPWQKIITNQDKRVKEFIFKIQFKKIKKAKEKTNELNKLSRKNPWLSLYYVSEFPKELKLLEKRFEHIDSVYISQSFNTLNDISIRIQNWDFEYLKYSPLKENTWWEYSTLSRLWKAKTTYITHNDIDSKNNLKSTGQISIETLWLKSILYWSRVIKWFWFWKVRFSSKNQVKFDRLSHLSLLWDKTVANDVHIWWLSGQLRVLTWPNGSGKTFHKQSIILGIMSAMSTWFVPAKNSRLPLFERVSYLDRVVEDSKQWFSAWTKEIQYWKEIWQDIDYSTVPFMWFDEMFSTTSPKYQEAFTVSVMDFLYKKWVLGVISTHNHDAIGVLKNQNGIFPPYYFEYHIKGGKLTYERTITKWHATSHWIDIARKMWLNNTIIDKAIKYRNIINRN